MHYRLASLVVTGVLGFVAVGCGDSSTPDQKGPMAGSTSSGSGGGGAASGGAGGSGGGSSGSATAGGGMGGTMSGSGGGGAGGGAGGTGGGGAGGGGGSGGGGNNGTKMSFFVTSKSLNGTGKLGGLAGADAHCKALATAAGAVRTQWVAYLSTADTDAKSRIGEGPWYNYDEDVFAMNQAALHGLPVFDNANATQRDAYIAAKPADELFMDETGGEVPSNRHDVLTGTNPDGTKLASSTCMDWTSDSADGVAMLGHSDTPQAQFSPSWNAAHASQGCDVDSLIQTGGEGRLYCFATD